MLRNPVVVRDKAELKDLIHRHTYDPAGVPIAWINEPSDRDYPVLVLQLTRAGLNKQNDCYTGVISAVAKRDWNRLCEKAASAGFPLNHENFVDEPDLSGLVAG